MSVGDPIALVDHLFRRQAGQMVATLTRTLGPRHLTLAEDAVQDALITAMQQWPFRGIPENPEACCSKSRATARESAAIESPHATPLLRNELPPLDDDQLGLLFLTCHPSLAAEARVALALKLVGGFSVGEIARAFLAQESAIAQRLVRAKRQLRDEQVTFGMPDPAELPARLDSVLDSLYLMFNEGYAATSGDLMIRDDVAGEAIRLARMIAMHPAISAPRRGPRDADSASWGGCRGPRDADSASWGGRAWALVALMLLHAARFPARVDSGGTLFLLREQDRRKWDHRMIAEGMRALDRAAAGEVITAFHLEVGIAACHAAAASWESTNWPQIVELYDDLLALTRSPVVAMNRAIAVSRLDGALAGLAALEAIDSLDALDRYPLLPVIQAELWVEAGEVDRAVDCYRAALGLARSAPEQRWLTSRLSLLV